MDIYTFILRGRIAEVVEHLRLQNLIQVEPSNGQNMHLLPVLTL